MSASTMAAQARALYRGILRELPQKPGGERSPIQARIRTSFSKAVRSASDDGLARRLAEGQQFVQYARAQRMYATLLERYNPGVTMTEEERLRLTMRRVGMELPDEWAGSKD